MISEVQARDIASEYLRESWRVGEPELAIDWNLARAKEGIFIAPYNSARFFETRNYEDHLLDCWPILVDMSTGEARFGELEEREFWRRSY